MMHTNCNYVFSTDQCLEGQIKREICPETATSTAEFVCTECNRSFSSHTKLQKHIGTAWCLRFSKVISNFICSNCFFVCTSKDRLKKHIENQSCSKVKKSLPVHKCAFCDRTFNYRSSKAYHQKRCSKRIDTTTTHGETCSDFTFASIYELRPQEQPRQCFTPIPVKIEPEETVNNSTNEEELRLNEQQRLCFTTIPVKIEPEETGNNSTNGEESQKLDAEQGSNPNKSSNLNCPHCNHGFTKLEPLYWHVKLRKCRQRKVPENDIGVSKPKKSLDLTCPHCKHVFTRLATLFWHVKLEKCQKKKVPKEVPKPKKSSDLTCPHCKHVFTRPINLYWHVKDKTCQKKKIRENNIGKIMECPHCKLVFASRQNLIRHIQKRTCLKKNKCPIAVPIDLKCPDCRHVFTRRRNLLLHITLKKCLKKKLLAKDDEVSRSSVNCEGAFASKRNVEQHIQQQVCLKSLPLEQPSSKYPSLPNDNMTPDIPTGNSQPLEQPSAKKRRLETNFGNSLAEPTQDTTQGNQQPVHENSTINFISVSSLTGVAENTIQRLQPDINGSSMTNILGYSNAFEDSVQESQPAANDIPPIEFILDDSCMNANEDADQQLLALEPNPLAGICEDSITIEDNVMEFQPTEKIKPVAMWKCLKCPHCKLGFANNQNLMRHIQKRICLKKTECPITAVPIDLKCPDCGRAFARCRNLLSHIQYKKCLKKKLLEKDDGESWSCANCECAFASKRDIKRHIQQQDCLKSLPLEQPFSKHPSLPNDNTTPDISTRNIQPLEQPKILKCHHCKLVFANERDLTWHTRKRICLKKTECPVTAVPIDLKCPDCGRLFARRSSLSTHIQYKKCLKKELWDPEMIEKWEKEIRRADRRLTAKDNICQLHFPKESIVTHDEIVLSNGDVYVSERTNFKLKRGAIPTIFPLAPSISDGNAKTRKPYTRRYPCENNNTSAKKRRLETNFGDRLAEPTNDTTQGNQQPVLQNSTINYFSVTSLTDAAENTIQRLQPHINESSTTNILVHSNALGDSVHESQRAANENPPLQCILDDSDTDVNEDADQQLLALEPNPLAGIFEDSITIEESELNIQPNEKLDPHAIWIKAEKDDCVGEFADSTAIEDFDDLFRKCSKIEFPDNRWAYIMVANNILITYWNASFDCTKKIIIDQKMKISAFVKDVALFIDATEVHDLNTVKNIVKQLHEIEECADNAAKSMKYM